MIVFRTCIVFLIVCSGVFQGAIIVIEDAKACFRRELAGSRTVRGLVRKLLICDTNEQCQQECGDERDFSCEGFNYRLDQTGRGKGECELLDLPLSRIDLNREIVPDRDYDFYTRDRNAAQYQCRQPVGNHGAYGGGYGFDYEGNRRWAGRPYDRRPTDIARPLMRPIERWVPAYPPLPPPRPPPIIRPLPPSPDYGNRRGDYSYHQQHSSSHESHHSYEYNEHNVDRIDYEQRRPPYTGGAHYLPASGGLYTPIKTTTKRIPVIISIDSKYPGPPLPDYPERGPWNNYENPDEYAHRYNSYDNKPPNYYIPLKHPKPQVPESWGVYGGTYGTGDRSVQQQNYGNKHTYNYWGFNKFEGNHGSNAQHFNSYPSNGHDLVDNSILPAEPRRPYYDSVRDECSLRSAAGFRLHKGIIRKFFSVPSIYDCELLCFKEKEFYCASYAFRYTTSNLIADNCYLSPRNYKELDYYTDLEPDRDFDIYTMSNRQRCEDSSLFLGREESDCFWRVRSGQRLENSVVRDSLTTKSTIECQLECLQARRFTCRAYSFRYGAPIIGGAIDNCQLTDWPHYQLDPHAHFIPDRGFEIYERGSFGHGCEPHHFGIKHPRKDVGQKVDQLCYVGFGSAAKLLPQATVKSLFVPTELDCKGECSTARETSRFRCMTFSFVTAESHSAHNCFLSDRFQQDLSPNVDYIQDPNSWLFTWDNFNPECIELGSKPLHSGQVPTGVEDRRGYDNGLEVWKVYTVSGWPCKRGTGCRENKNAGFWFCELEGAGHDAWDYCCSPDHQCGLSNGCYVGHDRTQWRKCSDQYYPYFHNSQDRYDQYRQPPPPPPHSGGFRPDRPNAPVRPTHSGTTLDQYETDFDNQFLSPPVPGGLGQPRRWPVAYLHKQPPPNTTVASDIRTSRQDNSKLSAIKSLIDVIQNTEIQNVQYNISNNSRTNDVLFVKIPLPKLDDEDQNKTTKAEVVEVKKSNRERKSLPVMNESSVKLIKFNNAPTYRKGYVTRTNVTTQRQLRIK